MIVNPGLVSESVLVHGQVNNCYIQSGIHCFSVYVSRIFLMQ